MLKSDNARARKKIVQSPVFTNLCDEEKREKKNFALTAGSDGADAALAKLRTPPSAKRSSGGIGGGGDKDEMISLFKIEFSEVSIAIGG